MEPDRTFSQVDMAGQHGSTREMCICFEAPDSQWTG